MLKNEYLDAKIGVDTAENKPFKVSWKWDAKVAMTGSMFSLAQRSVRHAARTIMGTRHCPFSCTAACAGTARRGCASAKKD